MNEEPHLDERPRPLQKEEELFAAALALPSGKRTSFLQAATGGDSLVSARVEALLSAHALTSGPFDRPAAVSPSLSEGMAALTEQPGTHIGRYKLSERIGEGGWGVVWMAVQEEPVRRPVALKVIKLGMDTRAVIARFEAERQALAMMDHPNIAHVFDAGATDSGRPFFVMELVAGRRITDFCDEHRLSIEQRLRLIIAVCHGVQHAHQKGVIHRDLKPSNILVAEHDGHPVPKIIDFGIAKATRGRLAGATVHTAVEQIIGTPAYMSPEQLLAIDGDVDTRSDIYALGALLHELLTGATPYSGLGPPEVGIEAIRCAMREREPQRPSARLKTFPRETLAPIVWNRAAKPSRLAARVCGDLDWIVLHCLESDRARRYATANELARDIERHLANEPVVAGPPGAGYRVRKYLRRHRAAAAVLTIVFGVLMLGFVVALIGQRRAIKAQRATEAALAEAEAVSEFLDSTLAAADPARFGHAVTVRAVLDATAPGLNRFDQRPLVKARVQETIGRTYQNLSAKKEAAAMLREVVAVRRRELGPDHALTLRALARLSNVSDDHSEAASLETVVNRYAASEAYPAADVVYARRTSALNLYGAGRMDEALKRVESAVALAQEKLPPEHGEALWSLANLAVVHWARGEFGDALEAHRAVLATPGVPADVTARAYAVGGSAVMEEELGIFRTAEAHARQALEIHKRLHGPDHPLSLLATSFVGISAARQERAQEGLELLQDVHSRQEQMQGPDSYNAVFTKLWVASALAQLGRIDEAASIGRDIWTRHKERMATGWAFLGDRAAELALMLIRQGRADEAEALMREVRGALATMPNRPYTLSRNRIALARALMAQGRFAEAETELRQNEKSLESYTFDVRAERRRTVEALLEVYSTSGRDADAAAYRAALVLLPFPE